MFLPINRNQHDKLKRSVKNEQFYSFIKLQTLLTIQIIFNLSIVQFF